MSEVSATKNNILHEVVFAKMNFFDESLNLAAVRCLVCFYSCFFMKTL